MASMCTMARKRKVNLPSHLHLVCLQCILLCLDVLTFFCACTFCRVPGCSLAFPRVPLLQAGRRRSRPRKVHVVFVHVTSFLYTLLLFIFIVITVNQWVISAVSCSHGRLRRQRQRAIGFQDKRGSGPVLGHSERPQPQGDGSGEDQRRPAQGNNCISYVVFMHSTSPLYMSHYFCKSYVDIAYLTLCP